jgi:hypothetical protein
LANVDIVTIRGILQRLNNPYAISPAGRLFAGAGVLSRMPEKLEGRRVRYRNRRIPKSELPGEPCDLETEENSAAGSALSASLQFSFERVYGALLSPLKVEINRQVERNQDKANPRFERVGQDRVNDQPHR